MKKRMIIIWVILILIFVSFLIIVIDGINFSKEPELSKFKIKSEKIPGNFNGFKIAQISDFHNVEFENENQKLIDLIKEGNPDIIVITGDFIDSRSTKVEVSVKFAEKIIKIAPCYYVAGNHESRMPDKYFELLKRFEALGVTVLNDENIYLEKNGEKIQITGIKDPAFKLLYDDSEDEIIVKNKLQRLKTEDDFYKILLSHRPELFDLYCDEKYDLIFAGHAHGGQFRFPLIGALQAPKQGLFPKYTEGLYEKCESIMLLSRGVGYSKIPVRIYCRPQIILAELERVN